MTLMRVDEGVLSGFRRRLDDGGGDGIQEHRGYLLSVVDLVV